MRISLDKLKEMYYINISNHYYYWLQEKILR